jgi:hypothetical protein
LHAVCGAVTAVPTVEGVGGDPALTVAGEGGACLRAVGKTLTGMAERWAVKVVNTNIAGMPDASAVPSMPAELAAPCGWAATRSQRHETTDRKPPWSA